MNEKVVVFEPDLLFSSRIESAAGRAGLDVKVTVTMNELQSALQESAPKVLLMNLDALGDAVWSLAGAAQGQCRLIGYYSHADSQLAARALASGFEMVVPRRTFMEKLSDIFAHLGSS
jgi:hypothetical protein